MYCSGLAQPSSITLLNEVAKMMRDPVEDLGSCGSGCCIEIETEGGTRHSRLLDLDKTFIPESDPCQMYICTVRENKQCLEGDDKRLFILCRSRDSIRSR